MKLTALAVLLAVAAYLVSQPGPPREQPGPLPGGGVLLNSGWKITPAGRQVPLDTLPMSTALSKDGKYLLVLNGGYKPPSISVLRSDTMEELGRTRSRRHERWPAFTAFCVRAVAGRALPGEVVVRG